jgi:hypothetical protein
MEGGLDSEECRSDTAQAQWETLCCDPVRFRINAAVQRLDEERRQDLRMDGETRMERANAEPEWRLETGSSWLDGTTGGQVQKGANGKGR